MSYPKKLNPEAELLIAPALKRMHTMKPNDTFTINCNSKQHMQKVRYYIHAFMHIHGLKMLFKIKTLTPLKLIVIREDNRPIRLSESDPITETEEVVMDYLLETNTEEEAMEILTKLVGQEKLVWEQLPAIMREWEEKVKT